MRVGSYGHVFFFLFLSFLSWFFPGFLSLEICVGLLRTFGTSAAIIVSPKIAGFATAGAAAISEWLRFVDGHGCLSWVVELKPTSPNQVLGVQKVFECEGEAGSGTKDDGLSHTNLYTGILGQSPRAWYGSLGIHMARQTHQRGEK